MKPVAIDLFCGLGGWAEGFLAEGYDVIGFDIERHDYGTGGYPGQLVLQDVLTLRGSQFKSLGDRLRAIVASPPCQKYSYMAMPWKRAKALARWYQESPERIRELNELFNACFRIQREASEALGRQIPLIVENVVGAQRWVGRAGWHFGSYYLWGDIPALIRTGEVSPHWRMEATKVPSEQGRRTDVGKGARFTSRDCGVESGVKGFTPNGEPLGKNTLGRRHGSKSKARKAASAMIAKIPFPLSSYIAKHFKPPRKHQEEIKP